MEKEIENIAETAALLIMHRLYNLEFNHKYLNQCIIEAIENSQTKHEK